MVEILEIGKVSKTYNIDSDNPVHALDGVDLNVAEGEFVSVIGPSGCGKSTLFNIIGGLIADYEGEVLIDGKPVDGAHKDIGVVDKKTCGGTLGHLTDKEKGIFEEFKALVTPEEI